MNRWKFCKFNGYWHLCISDLEQLVEYDNKTNSKYGFALVKGDEDNAYLTYARLIAVNKGVSLLEGMAEVQARAFRSKYDAITEGNEIWVNEVGGFNFGNIPEKTIYMDNLVFPHYSKEDIKISQWGGEAKGSHYYAKVGDIEVKDGDIMKWDTFQEAYEEALKYLEL